jgi:hypothetical protein
MLPPEFTERAEINDNVFAALINNVGFYYTTEIQISGITEYKLLITAT